MGLPCHNSCQHLKHTHIQGDRDGESAGQRLSSGSARVCQCSVTTSHIKDITESIAHHISVARLVPHTRWLSLSHALTLSRSCHKQSKLSSFDKTPLRLRSRMRMRRATGHLAAMPPTPQPLPLFNSATLWS